MKTEIYDNPADFLAAVQGKKRPKAKAARPNLPRAEQGTGDRIAQLMRIAIYNYSPRFDQGFGYSFWNPATGQRIAAHAEYAQACVLAERELTQS